ncbi:MAG TPA: phage tail protein [Actinomycetota bacterium]|nr:phage tail protein [Actinomycetota bacterium]
MVDPRALPEALAHEAVGVYFTVCIDGVGGLFDLGTFISCEGLSIEVQIDTRAEGGNNEFAWKVPGRVTYSNITLKRPIGLDTRKVAEWFQSFATDATPTTGRIAALTPRGYELIAWNLIGVIPARWQGPTFTADSISIATETLELAHNGFVVE